MIDCAMHTEVPARNPSLWLTIQANHGCLSLLQQASLRDLLSGRCRRENRDKLHRRIAVPLSLWPSYGRFERVLLDDNSNGFEYVAGQSYPDEIRELRELILKG